VTRPAPLEYVRGPYTISTDPRCLDVDVIHAFLRGSYWAQNVPKAVVTRSIRGSLCFGLYHRRSQVGFARVVTDRATFAYLADVFVLPAHRGRGLSKWLLDCLLGHPELQGLRRFVLGTRDAHGLYARFGFRPLADPARFMEIHRPSAYAQQATRVLKPPAKTRSSPPPVCGGGIGRGGR
jgi:GNAT superfamily N-acetyltransferase